MLGRVLIIAGSDSGGGAGIQADIKTTTALNGYATTALTALTAQDTSAVHGIHEVPTEFVRLQMEVVIDDIGIDCIKTGMLHRADVLNVVANAIFEKAREVPLVVDPVMVAKGGDSLLREDARIAIKEQLISQATIITPNLPEAELLGEMEVRSELDMLEVAKKLLDLGPGSVLIKGGHLEGDRILDILVNSDGSEKFYSKRLNSTHTHGTGCTLASAIATGLAQGFDLYDSVKRAREYVLKAISEAPGYGKGCGPLNHAHTFNV